MYISIFTLRHGYRGNRAESPVPLLFAEVFSTLPPSGDSRNSGEVKDILTDTASS